MLEVLLQGAQRKEAAISMWGYYRNRRNWGLHRKSAPSNEFGFERDRGAVETDTWP